MAAIYGKLVKELALYRRRNLLERAVLPQSVAEHRAILKAIASGDPDQAGRAMYDHVIESKERALGITDSVIAAPSRAARKG
jgi:DNA-binding FadR family transcriptional regulator